MNKSNFQRLEDKIRAACPETEHSWNKPHEGESLFQQFDAKTGTLKCSLQLHHVLKAIVPIQSTWDEQQVLKLIDMWKLNLNFHEQEPEVHEFLSELLL